MSLTTEKQTLRLTAVTKTVVACARQAVRGADPSRPAGLLTEARAEAILDAQPLQERNK